MLVAYMMAFLDKQALNYAALMGVMKDLHLVGQEYSWSSGIFYFGYLFFSSVILWIPISLFTSLLTFASQQLPSLVAYGQVPLGQIFGRQLVSRFPQRLLYNS